jgi:hypothetical protein
VAIAAVMKFKGGTLDQYDEVISKMGFKPGGRGAPHGLFHWVTVTPEGLQVTDVWDSKEEFETFAAQKIGPITAEAGVPGPPEITFHEVHNYLTAG